MRSRTKVEYFNEQYYVNAEKKTVVCALSFLIDLNKIPGVENFIEFEPIQQYLSLFNYEREICEHECDPGCLCEDFFDAGIVSFTVKGKSKASGNDEFNETVGRNLANTRAQMKAFEIAGAFYNDLSEIIYENMIEGLELLRTGSIGAWLKCSSHEDAILEPYMEKETND